jgi:hypothetical protein
VGVEGSEAVTLDGTPVGTYASKDVADDIVVSVTGYSITGGGIGNYSLTQPSLLGNITPKALTAASTVASRAYNTTTTAGTVTVGTVSTYVGSETLVITPSATNYADANVGPAKATTISYSLADGTGGGLAINYSMANFATTGAVTAKELTVTGLSVTSRAYNGGTSATLSGSGTLQGVLNSEDVTLTGTPVGTYASKDVADDIVVSVTGYSITGGGIGNYSLTQPSLLGNITKKALTVTATGPTKVYGTALSAGTSITNFTHSNDEVLTEQVTGCTLSPDLAGQQAYTAVGQPYVVTPSLVTGINGFVESNYDVTYEHYDGTVTAKQLTVTGLSVTSKTYDGGTTSTLTGTPVLQGVVNSDEVSLTGTPVGTFASPNVANGITVTVTGFSITGGGISNYSLTQPTLSGNITTKALTITAVNKTKCYDGAVYSGGYTVTYVGFISGEDDTDLGGTLGYSGTAILATAAGAYTITPGGYTSTNYAISFVNGTLTIDALRTISGAFTYYNLANTPLVPPSGKAITVELYQGVTQVGSDYSASSGTYQFTGLCPGTYEVRVTSTMVTDGSVNTTDAAQVNYWGVVPYSIEKVRFYAGDVTGETFYIQSTDALLIQQHFVNGTAFDKGGAWSFWRVGETISSQTVPPTASYPSIIVTTGGNVTANMYGLCAGDFNRSFTPGLTKSASTTLNMVYGTSVKANANQEFDLPVRVMHASSVGAVSLILNLPSDLVEVQDVDMNTTEGRLDWAVFGNELRIGWNSQIAAELAASDNLLTLKLKTTAAFTEGKSIRLALAADPLNELADDRFEVIGNALLGVDVMEASTNGVADPIAAGVLTLSNHPNPFRGFTTISYSLPFNGKVTLELRDMLGSLVKTMVQEDQLSGSHSLKLDAAMLGQGMYILTVKLAGSSDEMVRTIKIVNNK